MSKFSIPTLVLVLSSLCFTSCETPGESALAGAATGAVIGGALRGDSRDMAKGAAIGAAGGYAIAKYGEAERQRGYREGQAAYSPPPPREVYVAPAPPPRPVYYARPTIPYGRFSNTYGFVYSPYSGRLVDVRGVPSGARVVDPSTGRIFYNP